MLPHTPRTFVGSTTFTVRGLTAATRELVVASVIAVCGVQEVAVDVGASTVLVRVSRPVDRADIAAALGRSGFTVAP
jgi:hypothetical protein